MGSRSSASAAEPGIGVCIPTLDERDNISRIIDEVFVHLAGLPVTICVVDDGSTDGTVEIVQQRIQRGEPILLIQRPRQGHGCQRGGATRAGLARLLAEETLSVFVDLDADGSQRPAELAAGVARLSRGDCDVVVASKYAQGAKVLGRPLGRRLVSRGYNLLLRGLLRSGIRDYSNSYRFYSRDAAAQVLHGPVQFTTPVFLVEMMAIWLSNGMRIVELPTTYDARRGGGSKVSSGDFLRCLPEALAVGMAFRRGRYRAGDRG